MPPTQISATDGLPLVIRDVTIPAAMLISRVSDASTIFARANGDASLETCSANGFDDIERADAAVKAIGGKRLTYRRLDGKQPANA